MAMPSYYNTRIFDALLRAMFIILRVTRDIIRAARYRQEPMRFAAVVAIAACCHADTVTATMLRYAPCCYDTDAFAIDITPPLMVFIFFDYFAAAAFHAATLILIATLLIRRQMLFRCRRAGDAPCRYAFLLLIDTPR